ncbi:MAG TPA: arylesterase [Afifellaceae bacterium]|nr:arylesterase [Afifellaceae bacterium]
MYRFVFSALLVANSLLTATLLPAHAQDVVRIVALGDSLTAGYGLAPGQGFPAQLQRALDAAGHKVDIVDAGVSGDTASGGLARLDWSVAPDADAVIVELGANDALRGIGPEVTRKALDEIVARLNARNLPVLIAGMVAPPNMGDDYGDRFNAIYSDLAEKHGTSLYPFFLDGVAGDRSLNQADGIHPTAEGIAVIVENILPEVEKLIEQARGRSQ